jgi:hypothetical protein
MLIAKMTKIDTKLMKLVVNCAKVKINEALSNTNAKVDTKLTESVLNCAKSKINQTIGDAKITLILKLTIQK